MGTTNLPVTTFIGLDIFNLSVYRCHLSGLFLRQGSTRRTGGKGLVETWDDLRPQESVRQEAPLVRNVGDAKGIRRQLVTVDGYDIILVPK